MKSFKEFLEDKIVEEDFESEQPTKKKVNINPDHKNHLFKRHIKHIQPSIRTV